MTPQQLQAMKMALEALKWCHGGEPCGTSEAITALEEALAQPEQEPVGTVKDLFKQAAWERLDVRGSTKVYLDIPPQRTWVGLTNDEVNNFAAGCHLGKSVQGAIYEAEAKLKEKNQ